MSSLEDMYREVILDHYRSPRNRGELKSPPAIKSEGKNPVCGDELTLFILENNGLIEDVKISGSGCSISMASASMMSNAIKGKSIENAKELINAFKEMMNIHEANLEGEHNTESDENQLGELDALKGVVKFPVRIKCAVLAFNTLENALNDAGSSVATSE